MFRIKNMPAGKKGLYGAAALSVICWSSLPGVSQAQGQEGRAAKNDDIGVIVVTAQKRSEDVKDVPMSVSVLGGDALEQQKVSDYQDLGRVVPGLAVTNSGSSSLSRLSLRGISSDQGTSTVGVYLEDISLTIPNLFFTGSTLPALFDINHVEVLRGPQGTLFGASSLGGAIRFIPNKPKLDRLEGQFSGDLSRTRLAGTNYALDGVLNLPIATDKIALRVGVQRIDDSGFVTRYDADGTAHKNIGRERTTAVRATLLIQPDDSLSIEPALLWQETKANGTSIFQFADLPAYRQDKVTPEAITDRLFVPSLTIRKDIGDVQVTSISSLVRRTNNRTMDGQIYNSEFVASELDPTFGPDFERIAALPGPFQNNVVARQFSQELRVGSESTEQSGRRFEWQAGVYYFRQNIRTRDLEYVTGLGETLRDIYNEDPSVVLGAPLVDDLLGSFPATSRAREIAVFAQASYKVLPDLKLTVGGRKSWAKHSYESSQIGWLAFDLPSQYSEGSSERPFTPKLSLSYDAGREATFYATAAKGYRLGGENQPLPATCNASLDEFGITGNRGTFNADSLWSYEAGAKLRLFGNRLTVNASGFYVDWKNIQQKLDLASCGYPTTVNAGKARSYGAELEIVARVTSDLSFNLSGSLTDAKISDAAPGTGTSDGQWLLYVPRKNFTVGGDYSRELADQLEVHAHVDVNYTGKSNGSYLVSNPDYERPAYTVVNLNIGLTRGPVDLSFFVRNLFDNDTIIQRPLQLFVQQGLRVRPRTLGVSGTVKF